MSGVNKGVAVRFKAVSPFSTYVHCYGHILNLAIKAWSDFEWMLHSSKFTVSVKT